MSRRVGPSRISCPEDTTQMNVSVSVVDTIFLLTFSRKLLTYELLLFNGDVCYCFINFYQLFEFSHAKMNGNEEKIHSNV